MKAKTNSLSAPFILKLVGSILIFSSALDYLFVLIGLNFSASTLPEKQALVGGIAQLVGQGAIPLVGMALVLTGYTFDRQMESPAANGKILRLIILALSALLGLMFLFLTPGHFSKATDIAADELKDITTQAESAKGQVNEQIRGSRAQLEALAKDPKQLDEQLKQMKAAIASPPPNTPADQLEQLKQMEKTLSEVKANPASLNAKADELQKQILNRLGDQQKKAEKQVNDRLNGNRKTAINSLILAIGYFLTSWIGLSEMGLFGSSSSKPRRAPNT
ncbi:MAG: hypothetical protein RLZZ511_2246 [Cyanobacteriota bacterium]|jgi:hypothetical protein